MKEVAGKTFFSLSEFVFVIKTGNNFVYQHTKILEYYKILHTILNFAFISNRSRNIIMDLKVITLILALSFAILARPQDEENEDYDYYDYYNNDLDSNCLDFADKKEPELQFR